MTGRYGRLPYIVADALEQGEMSLSQSAILAFLDVERTTNCNRRRPCTPSPV